MTTCEPSLLLKRQSLFEATFVYKDPNNVVIDLSGQVDDADFTIHAGNTTLWTGSVISADIIASYGLGSFALLIPEADLDLLDFRQAKYRFRIHWIVKGWQVLASGVVIFDD